MKDLNENFDLLKKSWPSTLVARSEVGRFSGGIISSRYIANLDSLGLGPEERISIGRKIAYPVESLLVWLKNKSKELKNNVNSINKNKPSLCKKKHDDGLKNKNDILSCSKNFVAKTGIYFLINSNEIVYIGQSINVAARIATHENSLDKQFTEFSFIECPREFLNELEAAYIMKFNPKYNIVKPNKVASQGRF